MVSSKTSFLSDLFPFETDPEAFILDMKIGID